MKYTTKKLSDTKLILHVTLTAHDLKPIYEHTLSRLAKDVRLPGFRAGMAPAHLAEKQLDPNRLNNEVLEEVINHTASDIFETEKLVPLDRPKVEVSKYVPRQEVEYSAELEVLPKIQLGNYKKLKAKKEEVTVSDVDISDVLQKLAASLATKSAVQRAAAQGDEVTIDFDGKDKAGKSVPGASGQDYALTLGSKTFIPGFEEGLVGKKVGDAFDLPLTFPKDYHQKTLAGAKVTFAVKLKEVKEVLPPTLDDDFAKKAGPFKTLADLKADIRRELTDQKEREAVNKLKDSLIEQVVTASHVPTPDLLVADQQAMIERDFTQNLLYRGITLDDYLAQQKLSKDDWVAKELRPQAVRRVEIGLVLAELSKAEAIEVSKDELETRLQEMLQRYGDSPEMVKQLDTPEARRDLANRVLTEKTVDRLVELNK